ncbi:M14 family metallopeptidase [Flavobacterium sp.]|uniref:M14 family metallopeptidase n=1 Tax=Flavobacterium sp. TaxID=239 RepID=UPI00261113BF|nr:M14 family metallopeptidase [Flavobacterium sp.]MDD2986216.1 M14 family metallopeptidase [Flavobacterium sp.]
MNYLFQFLLLFFSVYSVAQTSQNTLTPYEKGNKNLTATYQETIDFFLDLERNFPTIKIKEMGLTDSGLPLHLILFNPEAVFDLQKAAKTKAILLINNNIHPGEPDGVDASTLLLRDLAFGKINLPKNTIVAVIPFYNISGTLNRNSTSRVNQNGPESYGFRANGRYFDLNRDFVKSDTKNARSFAALFHEVNPDVFIDNHVSNGADYQYTLTYIQTQHQKIGKNLGDFIKEQMTPEIRKQLKVNKLESIPYVNVYGTTPESGYSQFMDLPRYSTGYASLFNTIGYMPELHMLKNFEDRVNATYAFMKTTLNYTDANYLRIKKLRKENFTNFKPKANYTIQWQIDSTKREQMSFLGFEAGYKKSLISGKDRLFYDQNKPFNKQISFYPDYKSVKEITIPTAYIIPKTWWNVVELLKLNNISMHRLEKDSLIRVEKYRIEGFKTAKEAYEGHYNHYQTIVSRKMESILFQKGDWIIPTEQAGVKFLLETLEPEAVDSYFNWNFFDGILQQKEWYSAYVFEDLAVEVLNQNPNLKNEFEKKKATDVVFSNDGAAQLQWIYLHSTYYEKGHLEYPVYRLVK